MDDLTVIYITDSVLDPTIAHGCRKILARAAGDHRIISVSQDFLEFGDNLCVGRIGRSVLSMEQQIEAGLEAATSRWVAIAEHDCIYSEEHFRFRPPDDRLFWYNRNVWILRTDIQRFSYRERKIQSQMVCDRKLLLSATRMKLEVVANPGWEKMRPMGEPGAAGYYRSRQRCRGEELKRIVGEYALRFSSQPFGTAVPNVDIWHGGNLRGRRTGLNGRYRLEPWGEYADIWKTFRS